ncbi:MAG: class 1 fructose-bisphosphatase [Candidatus Electryonea clarkiae]|nr:class 1 fructose-bisphosphatase [Candidatus Electryonea clarkiae]MDP8288242.1 class 1 fructose-bisphosphatase [Candidatus Electryonea clarkiae]
MAQEFMTAQRFVSMEENRFPDATGEFSSLMLEIVMTSKMINAEVNKAGLVNILGMTGDVNVQGEEVRKLDEYANDLFLHILKFSGHCCAMASEEMEQLVESPQYHNTGNYVVMLDPLDGSSNIDANVSIGSIFAISKRVTPQGKPGQLVDFLQPGRNLVAAGYVIYGSSTMLVYTTGQGVHGFTYDPSIGTYLLSHSNIRVPRKSKVYSVNESYWNHWSEGVRRYVERVKGIGPDAMDKPLSGRYIGSLVADFHRNMLYGGIFLYPGTTKIPKGKLRLLYEANPMALLIENAGGCASNGSMNILDIQPEELHQRTPLFIGNKDEVAMLEEYIKRYDLQEAVDS